MFANICLVAAIFFLAPLPTNADTLTGKVVNVHDGDTITVLDAGNTQHKIRLGGIDAPELGQVYGKGSRESLAYLVSGQIVVVEYNKRDKYGRIVGKVLLDGKDQNIEQLHAGMAWHYKRYESEQTPEDRKSYDEAEQKAREAKRGLWGDRQPMPPWDWRRSSERNTK